MVMYSSETRTKLVQYIRRGPAFWISLSFSGVFGLLAGCAQRNLVTVDPSSETLKLRP